MNRDTPSQGGPRLCPRNAISPLPLRRPVPATDLRYSQSVCSVHICGTCTRRRCFSGSSSIVHIQWAPSRLHSSEHWSMSAYLPVHPRSCHRLRKRKFTYCETAHPASRAFSVISPMLETLPELYWINHLLLASATLSPWPVHDRKPAPKIEDPNRTDGGASTIYFAGLRESGAVGVRHGFHPSRPRQLPRWWGPQDPVPARDLIPSTRGASRHFQPELGGDGDPMSGRSPIPSRKPVQLTAGSVQFRANRGPSSACSSPAPSGADSSQVLSNSSAGPAQLIFFAAGSVQHPRAPTRVRAARAPTRISVTRAPTRISTSGAPPRAGSVQLTDASTGSVQVTDAAAGSAQLTDASAGSVQVTDAAAGSAQLTDASAGSAPSSPMPPLVPSSSPMPPLVPSSSPMPPLVPASSPMPPLVPPSSLMPPLVPSSSPMPPLVLSSSCAPVFPPSLPLPPPLPNPASSSTLSLLVPASPSARPQSASAGCSDPPPRDFQPPAPPRREDPLSPPPASKPWTPSRSFEPSAPPWPVLPPAPPGSLVPPAPPWSVVDHRPPQDSTPLSSPRHSFPPALSGSSFPSAPPLSSVTPAPPRHSGSPSPHQSPEPLAPPRPSGASMSPWLSVCSAPSRAPTPPPQCYYYGAGRAFREGG